MTIVVERVAKGNTLGGRKYSDSCISYLQGQHTSVTSPLNPRPNCREVRKSPPTFLLVPLISEILDRSLEVRKYLSIGSAQERKLGGVAQVGHN